MPAPYVAARFQRAGEHGFQPRDQALLQLFEVLSRRLKAARTGRLEACRYGPDEHLRLPSVAAAFPSCQ